MKSIEEIESEEMEQLKPDYHYYVMLGKLTLVECALILHEINPELYSQLALNKALMFFRSERGLLLPDSYVPKRVFQRNLQEAYKTYNILSCVEWNKKYGSVDQLLHKIPLDWLITETQEMQLNIPDDFLKYFDQKFVLNIKKEKNKTGQKPKQKRAHALLELIEKTHEISQDKSPKAIWKKLKQLAEKGHDIIQEVSQCTEEDAGIYWISPKGKEQKMGFRRFENVISALNNPVNKKFHS